MARLSVVTASPRLRRSWRRRRRSHGRRFVRLRGGGLRCSGRELPQNLLLVPPQLGDLVPNLLLTGRELRCEQIDTLPYCCQTERKLLQLGRTGAGWCRCLGGRRYKRSGMRGQPAKLRGRSSNHRSRGIAVCLPSQSAANTYAENNENTRSFAQDAPTERWSYPARIAK
jgi:hypothetical protein